MSTHNICFRSEIRKISAFLDEKKAPYLLLWLCNQKAHLCLCNIQNTISVGVLWCSGKASDSRARGTGFDPH